MAKTYPVIERNGGRVTVLARTAEEAHEAITNELGLGCTIVSVERVRSGGMGGFFATELVRLVAAPKGSERARADVASFASADDLVFALPGGGDQFAARLQQELAALTTKGIQAADATMNRPGPAQATPAIAARSHHEPIEADPEPRSARPVPIEIIAATSAPSIDDDPLPSTEELLWARDEDDDSPRRWRRSRGRSAAGDEPGDAHEHRLRDDPAADAALLDAWNDIETAPSVETMASFEPEPVVYETTGTDPREGSGWDTTRAVPSGYDTPVELPIEEHHALEQLLAEADLEDQIITPRARLIREGRARRDAVDDAVDERPVDRPAPIDVPAVDLTAYDTPLEFPIVPALSPVPPPAVDRPSLPVRNRVLVPSPVSLPTSWTAPTLRAFGVPDGIVDRMTAQAPSDDTEWTVAFMLAVRELCRSLPSGPGVLVGPSGANLARQLDLVSFSGDELGLSNASVASPNAGPLTLRRAAGGRHVHLVVGGSWHHLVTVRPTIVSAATEHDLVEALRVAEAWGATLGWTLVGERYVRVDPFLLAARIRELLPEPTELVNPFTSTR